jgi:glycosyltransferase involved in cell wall biosynthesis
MNVLQMCRVLTRAGFEVDLATYPLGEDVSLPGLRIHRAPAVPGIRAVPIGFSWRKVLLDLSLMLRVLGLVVRRRYRLVHAVEEAVFLALPLTWLGLPLIYDLDSLISDQLAYSGAVRSPRVLAVVRALERLALGRARAAITVCAALSEAARRLRPGLAVFQVEDAPLEEMERVPDPRRVAELRGELGLERRKVALYAGNLEAYQGIDLLVQAAPGLRARLSEATLLLVGGTPDQVAALRARVSASGLGDVLRVLGPRPAEEMPDWMALADVLVSPRLRGENTPLKLYSYMRSGRPIVATRLPTHTQVLDDTTATLCAPEADALAAALAEALRGGEAVAGRGARARALAERDYDFGSFQRKLLAAYADVLGESSASGGEAPGRDPGPGPGLGSRRGFA